MNNRIGSDSSERKSITLRDIAWELNISHATVSLSLRNHPRISAVTRDRIKIKADEMGYHRDPMLSALSRYRASGKETPRQTVLAWINPFRESRFTSCRSLIYIGKVRKMPPRRLVSV